MGRRRKSGDPLLPPSIGELELAVEFPGVPGGEAQVAALEWSVQPGKQGPEPLVAGYEVEVDFRRPRADPEGIRWEDIEKHLTEPHPKGEAVVLNDPPKGIDKLLPERSGAARTGIHVAHAVDF